LNPYPSQAMTANRNLKAEKNPCGQRQIVLERVAVRAEVQADHEANQLPVTTQPIKDLQPPLHRSQETSQEKLPANDITFD